MSTWYALALLSTEPIQMSQVQLNCVFFGHARGDVFPVRISLSENVDALRKLIAELTFYARPWDELLVYKLRHPIALDKQFNTFFRQVVLSEQDFLGDPECSLSEVIDADVPKQILHIVVHPAPSTLPLSLDGKYPRTATIQALYARLEKYKFLHVNMIIFSFLS